MQSLVLVSAEVGSSARSDVLALPIALSRVDRMILEHAFGVWRGGTFAHAIARLVAATERAIPAGRVYLLGRAADAPVIGSLVSGVGVTEDALGVVIVRVAPGASPDTRYGALSPIVRLAR